MANVTLGNYDETFFVQEALIQLEKVLGMAGRVHRDATAEAQVKGATVAMRRPATFTATAMPVSDSDVATESVNLTFDKWWGVQFALTDKDLTLSAKNIIDNHIRPATVAVADKIDATLAALYLDIPWISAQTATPALADIAAVRKIMRDNKVPLDDNTKLHFMVDSATELAYINALAAAGQQANTQDPALRQGSMGRLYGYDVWANQNTPSHTSGVAADATGAVDFGSGTTAVYAAGVSTIHIDGVTSGGTFLIGDTFVFAGHTQRYVLTANGTEVTGDVDITFAPPLKQAVDENEVITFVMTGSAKAQCLAFHSNAFMLGMAPLSTLGNGLGARMATATDPITGLSLRSTVWYDASNAKVKVRLDALWGVKTLDCNLAVRNYDA